MTKPTILLGLETGFYKLTTALILTIIFSFQSGAKATKPNFLWLVSEDNSKHFLKLYHPKGAAMPNIESLAQQGLVFENAFSNAPVCSTARTTLATGAYAPRLGMNYHRPHELVSLPEQLKTVSQYLMAAGYYTSNNSKEDYNFKQDNGPVWHASKRGAHWRNRAAGQPFFHMQSWQTTHESRLHFPATDVENQPTKHKPASVELFDVYPDTELFRYTHARYLDLHAQVDREIGQVLQQLKQDGELENTFIFYFGDHGGVMPASKGYPYERGLNVPLVIRIPENFKHLLHQDFQELKPSRINGFVDFTDFAPTLLNLAGIEPSTQHDGTAFLGRNISLPDLENRDLAFGYANRFDEKSDMVRTLRRGKYKYVRHFEPFNPDALFNEYRFKQAAYQQWQAKFNRGELNQVQSQFFERKPVEALYDIKSDPFETNNLASQPEYKTQLMSLRSELTTYLKQLPDLSFYSEAFLVQNAFAAADKFGENHQQHLSQLIDIANTQLYPFEQVRNQLAAALKSSDPWNRYWGLISVTSFDKQAVSLTPLVKILLLKDAQPLNRARAAQYLAMTDQLNPTNIIEALISNTENDIDALDILNIAAQLHDVKGYHFDIKMKDSWLKPAKGTKNAKQQKRKHVWFKSRVEYLAK